MSADLPPRPSLEYLKKHAKERLRDLQKQSPASQLADAQHELAREYGFPSWPKLRAHVEALAAPNGPDPAPGGASNGGGNHDGDKTNGTGGAPRDYGFARYTTTARRATFFSRWEASQLGSPTIETEHLLLGVIHAHQIPTHGALKNIVPPLSDIRGDVARHTTVRDALPTTVIIPFSESTKQVVAWAAQEAERLQHPHITTIHLLLGILQDASSLATRLLAQRGVVLQRVRDETRTLPDED